MRLPAAVPRAPKGPIAALHGPANGGRATDAGTNGRRSPSGLTSTEPLAECRSVTHSTEPDHSSSAWVLDRVRERSASASTGCSPVAKAAPRCSVARLLSGLRPISKDVDHLPAPGVEDNRDRVGRGQRGGALTGCGEDSLVHPCLRPVQIRAAAVTRKSTGRGPGPDRQSLSAESDEVIKRAMILRKPTGCRSGRPLSAGPVQDDPECGRDERTATLSADEDDARQNNQGHCPKSPAAAVTTAIPAAAASETRRSAPPNSRVRHSPAQPRRARGCRCRGRCLARQA